MVVNGETKELHISWTPPIQRGGYNSLTYNLYVYSVNIFGWAEPVHSMSRTIRDGSTNVIVRVEGNELKVYNIEVVINRIKAGKKPTPVCIDTKIPCKQAWTTILVHFVTVFQGYVLRLLLNYFFCRLLENALLHA